MGSSLNNTRIEAFFYGLFMDEPVLRSKGLDPQSPRRASVKNFQLMIGERATLVPREGETAYGMIFSLSQNELDELYSDPSVSVYRPENVTVSLENASTVSAVCYNLPEPPTGERNGAYAEKLAELAKRLGLPDDYVTTIRI